MRKSLLVVLLIAFAPQLSAASELGLERHAGKVVILDFWASWCVPCKRSFPWMNEMQEKYSEAGLVIIAVNVDREVENAAAFLAEYPANFEIVYDPDAALAKDYKIQGMPTSFVIGRDGETIDQHAGFKVKKQDEYEAVIRAALELPDDDGSRK
jgi:cytochrome c biogenesis protein CcmG/thiol:disulfide interchange protein DsbE